MEADRQINSGIGVRTAILSATAPGPSIEQDPPAAAALARQINLDAANIRDADEEHYGFFASLPSLLDSELALRELAYALDELHADGVILLTRYGEDNHYLGHKDFIPIWQELERRHAIVFIHPTHAVDTNLVNPYLPGPMYDYPHETGRTAIDLITQGRMSQVKNCRIILSHAGGDLPYVIYRVAVMMPLSPFSAGKSTEAILEEARDFYFDTAISSNPLTLGLLSKFARKGHILFGSDFPNAPSEGIKDFTKRLDSFELSQVEKKDIDNGGALALFPRLR